ncbi:MAG: hypothetical protein M0P69_15770 [Bacteroidales bacterium]|nr:hypothetical protein [Bacteroidales bacterium]
MKKGIEGLRRALCEESAFSFTHKNKKHVSESVHFSQKTLMSFVTSKYWEPVNKHKTLVFEVRLTVGEMNKTGLNLIYVNVSFKGDNSIDKIVIECQTDNGKKTINVQKGTREFAEIEDLAFEYGKKENFYI